MKTKSNQTNSGRVLTGDLRILMTLLCLLGVLSAPPAAAADTGLYRMETGSDRTLSTQDTTESSQEASQENARGAEQQARPSTAPLLLKQTDVMDRLRRIHPDLRKPNIAAERWDDKIQIAFHVEDRQPGPDDVVALDDFFYVLIIFDRNVDPASIAGSVKLERPHPYVGWAQPQTVPVQVASYYKGLVLTPEQPLKDGVQYKVTIYHMDNGPQAVDGGQLLQPLIWYFNIQEEPEPAYTCPGKCFGVRSQESFENDWQQLLWETNGFVSEFINVLDNTDTKLYSTNLKNPKQYFSSWCDQCQYGGLDAVDLAMITTHGAVNKDEACLSAWNEDVNICTNREGWRFGDEGTKLAFLTLVACSMLQIDEYTYQRWINTFRGGLMMALGMYDIAIYPYPEAATEYAEGLQDGKSVKWAWYDGIFEDLDDQPVAVMASGYTTNVSAATNCGLRRDTLTWKNFKNYARVRDDTIEYLCMSWIDDD